ncbi:hypothetical protein LTR50_002745 [Elasticomyces elasticus]|nr:hypothetical protein LTR50_002745 [Elasticomyces elasticus]
MAGFNSIYGTPNNSKHSDEAVIRSSVRTHGTAESHNRKESFVKEDVNSATRNQASQHANGVSLSRGSHSTNSESRQSTGSTSSKRNETEDGSSISSNQGNGVGPTDQDHQSYRQPAYDSDEPVDSGPRARRILPLNAPSRALSRHNRHAEPIHNTTDGRRWTPAKPTYLGELDSATPEKRKDGNADFLPQDKDSHAAEKRAPSPIVEKMPKLGVANAPLDARLRIPTKRYALSDSADEPMRKRKRGLGDQIASPVTDNGGRTPKSPGSKDKHFSESVRGIVPSVSPVTKNGGQTLTSPLTQTTPNCVERTTLTGPSMEEEPPSKRLSGRSRNVREPGVGSVAKGNGGSLQEDKLEPAYQAPEKASNKPNTPDAAVSTVLQRNTSARRNAISEVLEPLAPGVKLNDAQETPKLSVSSNAKASGPRVAQHFVNRGSQSMASRDLEKSAPERLKGTQRDRMLSYMDEKSSSDAKHKKVSNASTKEMNVFTGKDHLADPANGLEDPVARNSSKLEHTNGTRGRGKQQTTLLKTTKADPEKMKNAPQETGQRASRSAFPEESQASAAAGRQSIPEITYKLAEGREEEKDDWDEDARVNLDRLRAANQRRKRTRLLSDSDEIYAPEALMDGELDAVNGAGSAMPSSMGISVNRAVGFYAPFDDHGGQEHRSNGVPLETADAEGTIGDFHSGPMTIARVEHILRRWIAQLHEDHEHFGRAYLANARRCYDRNDLALNSGHDAETTEDSAAIRFTHDPFATMKPIQVPNSKASLGNRKQPMTIRVYSQPSSQMAKPNMTRQTVTSVPVTKVRSETKATPAGTHYTSLRKNVLAPNNSQLDYWPSFNDEANQANMEATLQERYDVNIEDRPIKLKRAEQVRKLMPYAEEFLEELGCDFHDVLRFMLEPDIPSLNRASLACCNAYKRRDDFLQLTEDEEFDRQSKRWVLVLSKLGPSPVAALQGASIACDVFQRLTGCSLWHLAKKSTFVKLPPQSSQVSEFAYRDLACRVCQTHNCPFHGEIRERSNSPLRDSEEEEIEDGDDDSDDDLDPEDPDAPPNINHKRHVIPMVEDEPGTAEAVRRDSVGHDSREHAGRDGSRNLLKGPLKDVEWQHHARPVFYPCHHPGLLCEDAQCRCFRTRVRCEKSCRCPDTCKRRYRGCTCSSTRSRKKGSPILCWQDDRCECFSLNRECDADLCAGCRADVVLDPVNRRDKEAVRGLCSNVGLQRNVPRRTLLGDSTVHGYGLYAGEAILQNEYIGEYKGEILTKGEAVRRGAIYEHQKLSYLFSLNRDQEIDSTRAGNKIRFMNHSNNEKVMNVYPKILLCNTIHRIGMYAKRDLRPGEELFFDYGDDFHRDLINIEPEQGAAPQLRNKEMLNDFWDPEVERQSKEREKEKGVAAKVTGKAPTTRKSDQSGRLKAIAPLARRKLDDDDEELVIHTETKRRGGARPGAGRKPRSAKAQLENSLVRDRPEKAMTDLVASPMTVAGPEDNGDGSDFDEAAGLEVDAALAGAMFEGSSESEFVDDSDEEVRPRMSRRGRT